MGIVANPRKGGNTEALTHIALSEIQKESMETELVSLEGKEVKPCDACDSRCNTNKCHIKDDFEPICKKIVEA